MGRVLQMRSYQMVPGGMEVVPKWQLQPEGVGLLFGHGIHNLDQTRWLTGAEIATVYAKARNIEDTSRQGRWHNGKFAALAEAMGLRAIRHKTIGHVTEIRPGTVTDYADVLADLASALVLYRVNETRWVRPRAPRPRAPEPDIGIDGPMAPRPILPSPGIGDDERADLADETGGATLTVTLVPVDTKNGLVGMCGCGRKLRGSVSAWKGGAVLCATCNQPFQITGPET
jgi:hypothetical protein